MRDKKYLLMMIHKGEFTNAYKRYHLRDIKMNIEYKYFNRN